MHGLKPYLQNAVKSIGVEGEIRMICDSSGKSKIYCRGFEILFSRLDQTTHDCIGSEDYKRCMQHYLDSSSEDASLAIEPACVKDLVSIVSEVYRSTF